MLRDKQFSINRAYRNNITNYHFINLLQNNKNKQNKQIDHENFIQEKKNHTRLNNPLSEKILQQNFMSKQEHKINLAISGKFQVEKFNVIGLASKEKDKQKEKIYVKISELIKNEELCISKTKETLNINSKLQTKTKAIRPYTSLSQKKSLPENRTSLGGYNYVLCIPPKQPQENNEASKVSTSRALIEYSKVFKNASFQKVKRKKKIRISIPNFLQLSTQKINFFQKQRPQKRDLNYMNKTTFISSLNKKKPQKLNRYQSEDVQSFEIGAWDYFE